MQHIKYWPLNECEKLLVIEPAQSHAGGNRDQCMENTGAQFLKVLEETHRGHLLRVGFGCFQFGG